MPSSSTTSSHTIPSTAPDLFLFHPIAAIVAALAKKIAQLARAWDMMMRPSCDGQLGGRRRDNRGPLLQQILRFEAEREGLEWEVFRARAMEMWAEDQWRRVGVDGVWVGGVGEVYVNWLRVLSALTDVCLDDSLEMSRVIFAPCTIS
jgi:hypothetical protein